MIIKPGACWPNVLGFFCLGNQYVCVCACLCVLAPQAIKIHLREMKPE